MPARVDHAWLKLPARDFAWACVVLALGLALTVVIWRYAEENAAAQARLRFDQRVSRITAAIVDRMTVYEQMLRGGLGLMVGSDEVTREDWRRYVEALDPGRTYPGVQGLGYTQWVLPEEREDFVSRMREDIPDFTLSPPGERDAYTAIVLLEPLDRRNRAAIGYDMWSDPVRRAAMAAARDRGTAVVSGRVRLVQEIDEDVQPGFLIYAPYYGGASRPATVEERRQALRGFVYSPFRMHDFMRGIDFEALYDVRLRIFDGVAASPDPLMPDALMPDALMYDSRPAAGPAAQGLAATVTIPLPGHVWTARFSALPAEEWRPQAQRSAIILGAGAVISLLFFGIAWSLARSRQAEALSARLGRIIEDSVSEIYVFDSASLRFLLANRGARENLGYDIAELRALTPLDLTPIASRAELAALLRPLWDGSEPQLRLQTTIRRKDGSTYEAEIDLQLSRSARPPVFIAIAQDITERRRIEAHQQLLMNELNHRVKNTLAVVQSLAARTLHGSASPAAFVRALRARIAALATSHTLLTQTHWNGVDLRDLVVEQLAPYGAAGREGIRVEGPPVFLTPAAGLALGLAFHELATNAAKHGALSTPAGRVEIAWRVEAGAADERLLAIDWIESGGPPVRSGQGRGFGLTVIERGLAYELDGQAELDFRETGLRCRIAVPIRPDLATIGAAAPSEASRRAAPAG